MLKHKLNSWIEAWVLIHKDDMSHVHILIMVPISLVEVITNSFLLVRSCEVKQAYNLFLARLVSITNKCFNIV